MPDPRRHRFKTALGIVVSVTVACLAGYVLYRTFQRIRLADVLRNVRDMPGERLLLASACAAARRRLNWTCWSCRKAACASITT